MPSPTDDAVPDTAQFPLARDDSQPPSGKPAHAVTADTDEPGISRAGWWAITLAAAALLLIGLLLTFGPARYWTPVPVVFLGYFLISGLIGLVFWKGVRELRDSNPTLHSGDGPASPGARVAAAVGAVGVASALILLPTGLNTAPANALPCPDGSSTCGPTAPTQDQPTQGNGGNTTAPQAPNTTVPGYTPQDTPAPTQGNGGGFQGTVQPMPTPDQTDPNACIVNCGPTQAPQQAPQTGQPTAPQTAQNPVTTAPNTVGTTPQAPTTTPKLRTPTPETTTSTTSSKARDRDQQDQQDDKDRDKNSGIPYQAAWLSSVAGTYRRKKYAETAVRDGQVVSEDATRVVYNSVDVVRRGGEGNGSGGDVSTGTGPQIPAAPKWTPHDPPTPYATQPIISRGDDFAYKVTLEHALLVISHIWPHSADMMDHFLSDTGDTKSVDPTTLMQDIPEFKAMVNQAIERAARAAVADAAKKGISGPVTFRTGWIGFYMDPNAYPDWFHAIGGFDFSVGGVATVSGDTISISPQVDIADFYNWDGGKSTTVGPVTINDSDMKDLVTAGIAQEFLITGSNSLPAMMIPK